jgi:VIT1/CCC1 family predicted Fe2+/Mn2+ transporter
MSIHGISRLPHMQLEHHHHHEPHRSQHSGWLRAAVLGANDGLISTSSLMLGMVTAHAAPATILLSGIAGLAAGALSMAAGEYVSVSSQADAEHADIRIEREALREHPEAELHELTQIYMQRGLEPVLARQVAEQLTAHDDLAAHLRDEVGIHDMQRARPVQAALASAGSFTVGALPPVLLAWLWQGEGLSLAIVISTSILLAVLGYVAERVAGGGGFKGALRVLLWGSLAQAATALIGWAFGVSAG